ncbi:MAG: HAD hydrolase family protein [Candidatus Pacearchaeota archaeon]|jgi:YrbI family 3-deoxy-D-manno-octulosonate 8-phosphate phosphatase
MKKLDFKKIKLLVLDFDGTLTDNRVLVNENGQESVFCSREDSLGLELLKNKTDVEVVVLSKEKNKVVQARCKKLKIGCFQGVDEKHDSFLRLIKEKKLDKSRVCFIGNDINDIECIKEAGIGVCVADSYPSVFRFADYVTKKQGGLGAVREVCSLILRAKLS